MEDKAKSLIASLAVLKAKQVGLVDEEIDNKQIGILGAFKAKANNLFNDFVEGKLTKQNVVEEVKAFASKALNSMVHTRVEDVVKKAVSTTMDVLHYKAKEVIGRVPVFGRILSNLVTAAYHEVKESLVEKVTNKVMEVGKKVVNTFMEKLKK